MTAHTLSRLPVMHFTAACEAYTLALQSKDRRLILTASLRVRSACTGCPLWCRRRVREILTN